jgi:phage/plasmid-associated DNA primase
MKLCLSDLKFEINHAQRFIREFVKLDKDGTVYKGELYKSYGIWAKNCGIREINTLCDAAFGKEVKRAFPAVKDGRDKDGHRPWKYVGISNLFDRLDGSMFVERIP